MTREMSVCASLALQSNSRRPRFGGVISDSVGAALRLPLVLPELLDANLPPSEDSSRRSIFGFFYSFIRPGPETLTPKEKFER